MCVLINSSIPKLISAENDNSMPKYLATLFMLPGWIHLLNPIEIATIYIKLF
jgi:hypothetical protein